MRKYINFKYVILSFAITLILTTHTGCVTLFNSVLDVPDDPLFIDMNSSYDILTLDSPDYKPIISEKLIRAYSVKPYDFGSGIFKYDYQDRDIVELKRILKEIGFNITSMDERYDVSTYTAIKIFQSNNNLQSDGVSGNNTFDKLDKKYKENKGYEYDEYIQPLSDYNLYLYFNNDTSDKDMFDEYFKRTGDYITEQLSNFGVEVITVNTLNDININIDSSVKSKKVFCLIINSYDSISKDVNIAEEILNSNWFVGVQTEVNGDVLGNKIFASMKEKTKLKVFDFGVFEEVGINAQVSKIVVNTANSAFYNKNDEKYFADSIIMGIIDCIKNDE